MLAALLLFAAFVTACGQSGQGAGSGSTTATPTSPPCGAYGTFGPPPELGLPREEELPLVPGLSPELGLPREVELPL